MEPITLHEAIDLFLSEKKPSTAASYAQVLDRLRDRFGASWLLTEITPLDIDRYFHSEIRPHDYAPATYNKHVKTLRTFFNWFVKRKVLAESPMEVKYQTIQRRLDRENAITEDELDRLINHARNKAIYTGQYRAYAMVLFAADTGARPGEIASVTRSRLNLENRLATVSGKTGERVVWYGAEAVLALTRWLNYRADKGAVTGEYIWSLRGNSIAASSISQVIRRACLDAGVRSMGTYYFRHRVGYRLSDARVSPTIAATGMGHDARTFIEHYGATDLGAAEKAVREVAYKSKTRTFVQSKKETG